MLFWIIAALMLIIIYHFAPETNPSALQEVISPGDGTNFPKEGDKLTMHYQ